MSDNLPSEIWLRPRCEQCDPQNRRRSWLEKQPGQCEVIFPCGTVCGADPMKFVKDDAP